MGELFGTDGIRGRANCHPITPEVALILGKAIAHVFQARGHGDRRALIGKDTRLSGYMLETALTSGLVSMGMEVFLVGPLPTPAVAHLTRTMNADAGIMLTASHNPFDDNGIKIFSRDGYKLRDEIEAEIERHVLGGNLISDHIRSDSLGKSYRVDDARGRYIEFAKSTVGNLDLTGMKVVLDCANGAAYQIGPWIFKELGADVVKTFADPDGFNINNGCGALHPETVGRKVVGQGADIGVAFDGDADRVLFCDAAGRVVDGDRILGMCALDMLQRKKLRNNTLVVTSMSNLGLVQAMEARGIKVRATEVGDRHVIECMRRGGYNLGGEKSGHIIFSDYATTGDGIVSALQVMKMMRDRGQTLAELADCFEEFPQRLESLPIREKKPLAEQVTLAAAIASCRQGLGEDGRVIVRYSGTENKIRLLVEARRSEDVEFWIKRLAAAAEKDLN